LADFIFDRGAAAPGSERYAIDGGLRIIKSGLSAQDRVIVNGIQRAIPGSTVKPVDAPAATSAAAPAVPAAGKDKP